MKRRKPLPIKKGDRVRVMTGKHSGVEGKVKAVFPEDDRVIVENVNMIKKTLRPTQKNPRGGFQEREAPIHVSKVRILDPQSGEPTRIGYKRLDSGRKVRVSVKSGASLDD